MIFSAGINTGASAFPFTHSTPNKLIHPRLFNSPLLNTAMSNSQRTPAAASTRRARRPTEKAQYVGEWN